MRDFTVVNAHDEIARDYVTYAVVTANRAIPSVIDGLKCVQRRIIQSALEQKIWCDQPFKKVARLDGYVSGNYHPHGGASGAIINLGDQSDYLNPLMMIHGNQGGVSTVSRQKISGDGAAAARYLECKLTAFAQAVFDIDFKFLKSKPNYDGTQKEITEFIPALPLALVNAQSGIGTGYATNTVAYPAKNIIKAIENINGDDALVIKSLGVPDFAFNTNIAKTQAIIDLHTEGRASIQLQGEWTIEKNYDYGGKRNRHREALIVTKIASGNAEQFIDQIKNCIDEGKIDGIANVIDETSKYIRVIIVCKKDTKAESLLPTLLRCTNLSSKYSAKFTLIKDVLPTDLTPLQILKAWHRARVSVLLQTYKSEIEEVDELLLLKNGLLSVYERLREIALLIMESESVDEAREAIIHEYKVTTQVADAILSIKLKKLTKLSKIELQKEIAELSARRTELTKLTTDSNYLEKELLEKAKLAAVHCADRVSEVVAEFRSDVPVQQKVRSEKPTYTDGISTRRLNKETKKYFDKSDLAWSWCGSVNELRQAIANGRHELEDIPIADAIKKSKMTTKRGAIRQLSERDCKKAMREGQLLTHRVKEHKKHWKNK